MSLFFLENQTTVANNEDSEVLLTDNKLKSGFLCLRTQD